MKEVLQQLPYVIKPGIIVKIRSYSWWEENKDESFYDIINVSNVALQTRGVTEYRITTKDYDSFFKLNESKIGVITDVFFLHRAFITDLNLNLYLWTDSVEFLGDVKNFLTRLDNFCNNYCLLDCGNNCPLYMFNKNKI